MFENIDIREVANGYIVAVTTEDGETHEYVYDTPRKVMSCVKRFVNPKVSGDD